MLSSFELKKLKCKNTISTQNEILRGFDHVLRRLNNERSCLMGYSVPRKIECQSACGLVPFSLYSGHYIPYNTRVHCLTLTSRTRRGSQGGGETKLTISHEPVIKCIVIPPSSKIEQIKLTCVSKELRSPSCLVRPQVAQAHYERSAYITCSILHIL